MTDDGKQFGVMTSTIWQTPPSQRQRKLRAGRGTPSRGAVSRGVGAGRPELESPRKLTFRALAFVLLHVPLAVVMQKYTAVATAHALVSWIGGIMLAASGARPATVICTAGYIAGAEVLWRAAQARVFYEGGKYAICAVLLSSMFRLRLLQINKGALLYFVLLIPSAFVTLKGNDFQFARELLSFNLSGPFALAVCITYFGQVRVAPRELVDLLWTMLGPLLGLASICSIATFGTDDVSFESTESNFQTSAGAGPNQVSSVLGWGVVCAFLWVNLTKRSFLATLVSVGMMLFFAMQAALTFSRSGVWMAMLGLMLASAFLVRNARALLVTGGLTLLVALLAWFLVLPFLDSYTGGQVSNRFAEEGFSNRDSIAKEDLLLFLENPVLGVGPGMGKYARAARFGSGGAAHTEFTRLFSEHGVFGVLALLVLLGVSSSKFVPRAPSHVKAVRYTALFYSFLFMCVTAMRVALPAFVLGLGFLGWAQVRGPGRQTLSPGRGRPGGPPLTRAGASPPT